MAGWIAWMLAGLVATGTALADTKLRGTTVRICDDAAEWPPYSYYRREAGRKTAQLEGYSVDVITTIFAKHGIAFSIELLPWKRCLSELAAGQRYQMLLSASANPERRAGYLLSQPYYRTRYHYFYSRLRHPEGLRIEAPGDLNRYALGGINGYAYSRLEGVDLTRMQRTINYPSLIRMLQLGRIDVFAEDIEVIQGLSKLGADPLAGDPALGHAPLPGVGDNLFHMMFSKNHPLGARLKALVDRELALMESSGQLQRLLARHQP
ncbi:transporter substrate-binding domain-containing protein [Paucibacter sp. O1-1]|nr:transporter substrate-binding domain-containing protein [Paucibacter sp. O1-1]MDA3829646.1 transporter substrate-binding domain-containing protein [Paucibacter sp. O1-1]